MSKAMNVAIIGLDSSHSIEFARRIQAPDCPKDIRVDGMNIVSCLRFDTPFQDTAGLDGRQKQLEEWGIKVTENWENCVAGCDAILMVINDPARHLEYFQKCVDLGLPVYIDKPLADTLDAGLAIRDMAVRKNASVISCSSLRYMRGLLEGCSLIPKVEQVITFGPLGKSPAGNSIVWYGVHCFEMLQRAMGSGAASIATVKDARGLVAVVAYADGRRGTVTLTENAYQYGGVLIGGGQAATFIKDHADLYTDLLKEIAAFFRTGHASSLTLNDAVEVMAMLDACRKSYDSGKPEKILGGDDLAKR